MNKFLLFTFSFFSLLFLNAQDFSIYEGTSFVTDISGTTVEFTENGTTSFDKTFSVKNNTTDDIVVKIRRVQLQAPLSEIAEQVCWGPIPDPGFDGFCYDYNSSNSNWLSNNTPLITPSNFGELKIKLTPNATSGSIHYRYYLEGTDVNRTKYDSIDVKILSTLSLKEFKNVTPTIQVYPNPVDNVLNILFTNNSESFVKITDVLGKTILEDKFVGSKKVDVNTFKNGVYIVAITNNGTTTSKRIVVRH
jgi:hypothetical protein